VIHLKGFYLGDERTSRVLLQERAVDVLGKEGALLGHGCLLDGAALALHQDRALDVLAEDGAARRLLQVGGLKKSSKILIRKFNHAALVRTTK
jgi:hypothetical protein